VFALLLLTGLKPRWTTVGPLTSRLLQLWRTSGMWCSWLLRRRAKGPGTHTAAAQQVHWEHRKLLLRALRVKGW
jgi:hypothetical protein